MASNAFVLATLSAAAASEQTIVQTLNTIFAGFPSASRQYSMYFQLLPTAQDVSTLQNLFSSTVHQPDQILSQQIHPVQNSSISAVFPNSFSQVDPFKFSQPSGAMGAGPQNGILIVLDGFNNARVPIEVALVMEANFIDGFVTRLVLGQFKRFWDSNPGTIQSPSYAVTPGFSIDVGPVNPYQPTLLQFGDPNSYPGYQVIPNLGRITGSPTYQDDLQQLLSQNPITSLGMLYGWHAAEQLEQADAGNPNQPLTKEAFTLLGYRFSIKDFGEMTAFTLNYLNGATKNESIQRIINGSSPITPPDLPSLLKKLGDDPQLAAAKSFLVDFENVLTAEFYALSQNSVLAAEKLQLLTLYFNFLQGFHEGIAESADVHYEETLQLAFGLGYNSGFTDGYALGYANGYKDGFATGNAVAWRAADQIIDSLRGQIDKLQQQLAQVQAAQDGGGSGGGFWDKLGRIAHVVETAIGVIATYAGSTGADAGGAAAGGGAAGGGVVV